MDRSYRIALTALLGAAVFSFWMWLYPQALNYQEQNQLFLFTLGYLGGRLALPGGFADWVSEFLVQLFYVRWAGALVHALLAVLLQLSVWRAARCVSDAGNCGGQAQPVHGRGFLPPRLVLL